MADKMLIDATHPEETRVVVLRGNRVEEFDFESANRKQLRGNIYLAKVTRVEPSLQAAFVDYGGNRHGFLAFSEIHPDYYQIPVADRQALLAQEENDHRAADADAEHRANRRGGRGRHRHRGADRNRGRDTRRSEPLPGQEQPLEASGVAAGDAAADGQTSEQIADATAQMPEAMAESHDFTAHEHAPEAAESHASEDATEPNAAAGDGEHAHHDDDNAHHDEHEHHDDHGEHAEHHDDEHAASAESETQPGEPQDGNGNGQSSESPAGEDHAEEETVESVGGADALEEVQERMPRFRRQYKIQEVIKRRQVMLVQVVKEERGSKGAALTTYLSLAGRYSVLMPNTARGGGISRKITSGEDRSRLKEIAGELEVPQGMGVILRTAGASRTKTEVKRDFEYLLRLWETVRDLTLKSTAPKLVYEEGSLAKRSIRDLYSKDIDEIVVAGEQGYRESREFMRMLMPSHVKHVKLYKDVQPIFTRYGIESQLDAMFSPIVQLRSGGYIVINQAEALVAIDVNSGRATREHHIEDTALKTNGEAAEEIARQLRLRDLAGLIVIDFIDMDEMRNNRTVERRMKDALKNDRARIQVGRISHFGLLEMSRQRIRSSVLESSTEKCPVCGGSGHVRSVSSVALQLLRALEEMLIKGATHSLIVRTRSEVALYVLNHKRAHLRALEERFRIAITISADPTVTGQVSFIIDRGEQVHTPEAAKAIAAEAAPMITSPLDDDEDDVIEEDIEAEADAEAAADASEEPMVADATPAETGEEPRPDGGRRRRRRGRGRGRGGEPREPREGATDFAPPAPEYSSAQEDSADHNGAGDEDGNGQPQQSHSGAPRGPDDGEGRRRRRRGRRGGRRNRRDRNGEAPMPPGNNLEPEPGLQHAVEDLDRPPTFEPGRSFAPPPDERPAPPQTSDVQAPGGGDNGQPRRRSTVREAAPFASPGAPPAPSSTLPPPTPVISSTANEESATPKRGWWGKRLLGDKE
ncbi:MAG TPA: Rne/Rng family ribonuclease [Pseudolabrys sp.]|nr:Rne/Rng family ribonuclease [Pseudolabrys sp.]